MKNNLIIEMKNIRKEFPNIIANDNISLNIEKNEIHAIIGENGAGKSTLMSILFGHYKPTSGEIHIKGQKRNFSGPNDASNAGLGMVHQHFKLVDTYSVLENIVLGNEPQIGNLFITFKNARTKLIAISEKYGLKINPDLLIKDSTVGEQQRTEILKILYRDAEILIFDEPTAVLTPQEIKGFLQTLKDFKKMGKTIIIITHKLDEVKEVANRATIIRYGKKIKDFSVKNTSMEKMAEWMVGRKIIHQKNIPVKVSGNPLLKLDKINVPHREKKGILGLIDFSLEVKSGEIVAIAGIEGNGQTELADAIYGLSTIKSGEIYLMNEKIKSKSIKYRNKLNISFIPEDRLKYGIIEKMTIDENLVLKEYNKKPYSKSGFINKTARNSLSNKIINKFDIRGANLGKSLIRSLSGGNQQKAIVGREMEYKHDLLLVAQPTRGLDVGAIEFIHGKIIEEKNEGKGILLISYDLSEIMTLADRIIVINSGRKIAEVFNKNISREKIGLMMSGIKNE